MLLRSNKCEQANVGTGADRSYGVALDAGVLVGYGLCMMTESGTALREERVWWRCSVERTSVQAANRPYRAASRQGARAGWSLMGEGRRAFMDRSWAFKRR